MTNFRAISIAATVLLWVAMQPANSESIPLKMLNGDLVVPVLINDKITLDFILDTGASEVSIPVDVYLTLRRTNTITDADLLVPGTFTFADGSQKREIRFRIRTLKVGSLELHNIAASVAPVRATLLLGQTFLSRVQTWSVDNERHVLLLKAKGPTAAEPEEAQVTPPSSAIVATSSSHSDAEYACGAAQKFCSEGAASLCADYRKEFTQENRICPGVYDPDAERSCRRLEQVCQGDSTECAVERMELRREGTTCRGVPR